MKGANVDSVFQVLWIDSAGTQYSFQAVPIGTPLREVPGVYVFCYLGSDGLAKPVYIGETDNLHRRLCQQLVQHHQWQNIRQAGATHVSVYPVGGALALRQAMETRLRNAMPTPCNEQIDWARQLGLIR
jgi:hypothetical protein